MKKEILIIFFIISSLNAQDLKMSVDEVLSTNPIILERLKNYNVIKEDITSAKAGYYPKLDLSLGAGYENSTKTNNEAGITADDKIEHKGLSVYQSSLTYTQNLFKGFETVHQVEEQQHKTTAAAYSYIEKANNTAFEMVNTYIQVMKNMELLDTAKENVDINQEIFIKVEKLYEAGLTTLSEVNKIESSLSLAKSNYIVQENTLMDSNYNMQRVIGRYLDPQNMLRPKINTELPLSIEEAAQFAMKNNPSLLVSKYNIKLAQVTYKEKKSPFYPQIDIEVSQSMNKNLSGLEVENDRFRAMAYLKYNFFNGFADEAALQKSISSIHQEIELKNTLRREVIEGLNLSWTANEKLTRQLVHLKDYKKFSLKTLTLYSKEYDLGRRSLLDLVSAQKDFIGSKAQIINTEYSILFAKYRILDAMGILISDIIGNTQNIYSNVGLVGEVPQNKDSLPVSFDKDRDLIVDEEDICNNSLTTQMRNIYGCKEIDKETRSIERYDNFLFKDNSSTLSDEGLKRVNNLIVQIKPYGWKFLKFDILANAMDDKMSEEKLQELSQRRAQTIKTKLIKAGADSLSITLHAKADNAPIYSIENDSSVTLNNRVDIIVRKLKTTP